jgi:hypothetical protein
MLSWTSQELKGLCKTPDLEREVKMGGFETLGHVIGMDPSRNILKVKLRAGQRWEGSD